ncbi:MAG: DUF916 domain-containing protein [Patescibacteria group bacterium]|nr:DUF916 domain-containing protein [Patescibacteria group bacterium]
MRNKKVMKTYTMSRILRLSLVSVGALMIALIGFVQPSSAAGPTISGTGGNGLRVSPVRKDVTIEPGKSEVITVSVTNVTSQAATLQTIVNDFTANPNESGNPAIILDPKQFAPSHSLKRFVGPIANVTLQPGQTKPVLVTVTVPKDAAAGGYYGAVRFAPAGVASGPDQTVSLAGSVGSLILVKVPGNIREQLSIASFDIRQNDRPSNFFTTNKDLTATVRFQNQGNLQESPFGKVLLKNSSGKIITQFELNNTTPPANVLPDSIRKFPISINKVGKFGKYKVEGNFGYGASGQLLSASTSFYVIPKIYVLLFICFVLFLVFLVFGLPRLVKAYNRRVIRNARRR